MNGPDLLLHAWTLHAPDYLRVARKRLSGTLRDHASALWAQVPSPACEDEARSRLWLAEMLAVNMRGQGAGFDISGFVERPVLHTAAHCQLLIDPLSFASLCVYLGEAADGAPAMYLCATNKLQIRSRTGPGWLTLGGKAVSLFGLGSARLGATSVAGLRDKNLCFDAGALPEQHLASLLSDLQANSATDLFSQANAALLNSFGVAPPAMVTDADVAQLVARHIEQRSGLHDLVFMPSRLDRLLEVLHTILEQPCGRFLPWGTDLFWHLDGGKCTPLQRDGRHLVGKNATFELTPDSIGEALRKGLLLPNLFLTFLVLGILPGARVLGGHRQVGYYPIYHAICATLFGKDALPDARFDWVLGVLNGDGEPLHVLKTGFYRHWDSVRDQSLACAVGDLYLLREDAAWLAAAAEA
jgi:hypothetical protein